MIAFCVCFYFAEPIFEFLVEPFRTAWAEVHPERAGEALRMVYTHGFGFFFVKLQVALFAAIVAAFPVIAYQLYAFIGPWVRRLNKSGRVVVLGRPAGDAKKPVRAATRAGLEGFTRSLAKEIGANGSTANSVFVQEGADDRLDAVLRFLLSPRSAYISCQSTSECYC